MIYGSMTEIIPMFSAISSPSGNIFKIFLSLGFLLWFSICPARAGEEFISLAYHDIPPVEVAGDDVSEANFIKQLEFFQTHGYTFISPQDILNAAQGKAPLPHKAILLTFDDAYLSFYKFVFPTLKLLNIPAVLSVVISWIDNPEAAIYPDKALMNWDQLREVARSPLVTIASHTHDLHKFVRCNPDGNKEAATETFIYFPDEKRYESEAQFRTRLREDLRLSRDMLHDRLGVQPLVLTWPYGAFNKIGVEEGRKLGFEIFLTVDRGMASAKNLDRVYRYYVQPELYWVQLFQEEVQRRFKEARLIRAAQVDLDTIVVADSYAQSDHNLGVLIERLVALGVNTVFLQGFCDREGSGNIRSVYFHNDVLPVEMDFLSHAVNRIRIRGIRVYVWMPALSFVLPHRNLTERLLVQEWTAAGPAPTSSWYKRLTPFDPKSLEISRSIFASLARQVNLDGILFQDDAYLTDKEDFHPAARQKFREVSGVELYSPDSLDADLTSRWTALKTQTLDTYLKELGNTVRVYRPRAELARNIYSIVVTNPEAENWFAQNLQNFLTQYNYTVIMAYSRMEGIKNRKAWYDKLISIIRNHDALEKTVFKVQTFDWRTKRWLDDVDVKNDLSHLLSQGARHIAYYPDDALADRPQQEVLSIIISGRYELNPN